PSLAVGGHFRGRCLRRGPSLCDGLCPSDRRLADRYGAIFPERRLNRRLSRGESDLIGPSVVGPSASHRFQGGIRALERNEYYLIADLVRRIAKRDQEDVVNDSADADIFQQGEDAWHGQG